MNSFKRLFIAAALGALIVTPATAQKSDTAQAMLEAAKQKETLEGDLAGAIKQYQAVVDKYNKTDRHAAADALVAMAACYQKQGDAQGRKLLERVVREFADQKEAVALARTRLERPAAAAGPPGMASLQKWAGPKVDLMGTVSRDGRWLSFVDWETGDLALHELSTGLDHRLTNKGPWSQSFDFAEESTISPDGTQVAYSWSVNDKGRYEIRILKLDAAGTSKPRTIVDNPDIVWIGPYDWSPDGKWLAVELTRKDRTTQLGLVDVTDGSVKILKSLGWRSTTRMFFSPEGTLVAYDLAASDASDQRDVFVLSIDGSRDIPAVVHPASDVVMGWAPDGQSLLFASDRAGSMGIWSVPFINGNPKGSPTFLKDLGNPSISALGLTRAGNLLYGVRLSAPHIEIASFDFQTGKLLVPPRQTVESYVFDNRGPDWSRDGKYLVYTSERPGNRSTLAIQSVETGQTRMLRLQMASAQRPRWLPDGSILFQGTDATKRQGIYRADAQTGESSPVVLSSPGVSPRGLVVSADGTRLFYLRVETADSAIVERSLASGSEREVVRKKGFAGGLSVSPDGRQLTFIESDRASTRSTLNVMSTDGGPARELFRPVEPVALQNLVEWTPDGRVVFGTFEPDKPKYWIIPATGGTPMRLELDAPGQSALRIHPDGRQVAFTTGVRKWEVWTLENFLPATTVKK